MISSTGSVYDACLWANQYLGVVGFGLLMFRITPLLLSRARWRDHVATHRTLLFATLGGYAVFTAFGAIRARGLDFAAGWPSLALTVLHVAVIVLCLWWPPAKGKG